jgi:hypothetical protein
MKVLDVAEQGYGLKSTNERENLNGLYLAPDGG